ncbi:nucleotidyltransferase domain-containing protein [Desulfosoma sp.]
MESTNDKSLNDRIDKERTAFLKGERREALASLCQSYDVEILYAFGSRGREALEWVHAKRETLSPGPSDLDVGVKPRPGITFPVRRTVELALALEDLFGVSRVDLVFLPHADPFLAANIIRGERLYAVDPHAADEYDLYVLRRAGDCAYLERQRLALILGSDP